MRRRGNKAGEKSVVFPEIAVIIKSEGEKVLSLDSGT